MTSRHIENPYLLLTPGPLSTTRSVKEVMLRDWCTWDDDYNQGVVQVIRRTLVGLATRAKGYTSVLMQGSGTFAVEALVGTAIARDDKLLVLANGAYGRRVARIAQVLAIDHAVIDSGERDPLDPDQVDKALAEDPAITHVAMVHGETSTGMLNPIATVGDVVRRRGRIFIVDAMSTFGAIPIDAEALGLSAVIASANKCLEGVPGMGFAVIDSNDLAAAGGNATSLSLDLHDQWQNFEKTGQWRFTPPTHVLAALAQAIQEHGEEGGIAGRGHRYADNCRILRDGMEEMGFVPLLSDDLQAPVIVTYHAPSDENYDFGAFYDGLHAKGFAIYPGKITKIDSFRIGCIGRIDGDDIRRALAAISETLAEQNIVKRGPK